MMEGKECGGSHTNEPRTSHMSHTHTHTYTHTHMRGSRTTTQGKKHGKEVHMT
jgi:hypothetical protein